MLNSSSSSKRRSNTSANSTGSMQYRLANVCWTLVIRLPTQIWGLWFWILASSCWRYLAAVKWSAWACVSITLVVLISDSLIVSRSWSAVSVLIVLELGSKSRTESMRMPSRILGLLPSPGSSVEVCENEWFHCDVGLCYRNCFCFLGQWPWCIYSASIKYVASLFLRGLVFISAITCTRFRAL